MPNFFISKDQIRGNKLNIQGDLLRHLRDSLRIKKGERIVCVDSESITKYIVHVSYVGRDVLIGDLVRKIKRVNEEPLHIHLVQAIPAGSKLDMIIQKSTELGVSTITPLMTERCVVRIRNKDVDKKLNRWRKIAIEAAQQSNRWNVPEVMPPLNIERFISTCRRADLNLLLWEGERGCYIKDTLRKTLNNIKWPFGVILLVGPEGGFSDMEVQLLISNGFVSISLGDLILRTETASLAALSIIQYELKPPGNWSYHEESFH